MGYRYFLGENGVNFQPKRKRSKTENRKQKTENRKIDLLFFIFNIKYVNAINQKAIKIPAGKIRFLWEINLSSGENLLLTTKSVNNKMAKMAKMEITFGNNFRGFLINSLNPKAERDDNPKVTR